MPLLTDRVDAALMDAAPGLKIIANVAVGYDNVDVAAATARGILVSNTPGVLTEATADLTMALLLAAARRLTEADAYTRAGHFDGWELFQPHLGLEVSGQTLGIAGMGRIGSAVARRAAANNIVAVLGGEPAPNPVN
jgi:glyoxylate reductase